MTVQLLQLLVVFLSVLLLRDALVVSVITRTLANEASLLRDINWVSLIDIG